MGNILKKVFSELWKISDDVASCWLKMCEYHIPKTLQNPQQSSGESLFESMIVLLLSCKSWKIAQKSQTGLGEDDAKWHTSRNDPSKKWSKRN